MLSFPRFSVTAALLLGSLVEPASSHACAGPTCMNDQFLPWTGSLPANVTAIAWSPGYDVDAGIDLSAPAALPRFECQAADGSTRQLSFSALPVARPDHLELNEPLVAGEHCTLTSGITDCHAETYPESASTSHLQGRAELEVVASAPLPEALGLLAVAGPRREYVDIAADASCSERVEACLVDVSVAFSAAALPWKDAWLFETLVDGEPFSTWRDLVVPGELGGLYDGRDRGVVFVLLGAIPENAREGEQLEAGEHTLAIRAHLPGSEVRLSTPPVTVNLDCGPSVQPPLAANEFSGSSDGCSITHGLGSSQRRQVSWSILALMGALLVAGRRRTR